MKLSLAVAVLGCVAAVSAMPFQKRQFEVPAQDLLAQAQPAPVQPGQPQQIQDVDILQFALSLENLEFEFYKQGLDKFSEADFRRENIPNPTQTFQNLHHIKQHEEVHVATLQKVIQSLGAQPVPPCEYQFPFQTARQFLGVANALEKVGVSAYNGALAIMDSPDLQTAAATIDTVEARHASFLQTANGGDPFPENFDVALDAREVTTLATPFIKQCSFDLGFIPFGPLQVKNQIHLPESDVECAFQQQQAGGQLFCNWLFSDQSIVVPLNGNLCKIPPGARGDIYLAITNDQTPLSLKKTDTIVAGPAIVTVDTAHTDSCKELFSGKKLPEPKLNQPMDHGAIKMNDPNAPVEVFVPPPVGFTPPPPSPELVTAVPPAPVNALIDVPSQDPAIQSLFAETQACANPPPEAIPPTDLATGIPPAPLDPQLTTSVPPPSTEVPPAYGSPPLVPDNVGAVPPAYGDAPPPLQDNIGAAPPAYGEAPPPVDPNVVPPVDAYGAPPVDPNAVPPTDPNAALPLELTTPTDPNALPVDPNAVPVDPNALPVDPNALPVDPNALPADPATNSLNAEPVISDVDNLDAPDTSDESEFPDL